MKQVIKKTLTGLACVLGMAAFNAAAQEIAIVNAEIMMAGPTSSPQTIDNGTIIISNGRIVAVGANVSAPAGAEVIDAGGNPVTPGIFSAWSTIGLEEISLNNSGNDTSVNDGFPISAALDASDAFYPDSTVIPINRAGGITRAYTTTNPSSFLFGGCGMVVDFSGDAEPFTDSCIGQAVVMGYSGAFRTGDNKAAAMAQFRYYIEEVRTYARSPADYRFTVQDTGLSIPDMEALVPFVRGEKPFLVNVNSASDIRRMIDLKNEYGLDFIFNGVDEGWRVADEIAAANIPVLLNPLDNRPGNFDSIGSTLKNAAILSEAGVIVAITNFDTHNLRLLPQLAGNAVANGMDYDAAIASITLNPAIIWGVDRRLGTIQAGKIADVVVWDGDPLEVTTRPATVIINGEIESLENRQSIMAERYKDLSRGEKPFAYRKAD